MYTNIQPSVTVFLFRWTCEGLNYIFIKKKNSVTFIHKCTHTFMRVYVENVQRTNYIFTHNLYAVSTEQSHEINYHTHTHTYER